MPPEVIRLRRLQRLEQVRAIAKQTAAHDAAQAEASLQHLRGLAERTCQLAHGYDFPNRAIDGLALGQLHGFVAGLRAISINTARDAAQAQTLADRKQHELAHAERARAAVQDRAEASARIVAQRLAEPMLNARRAIGTELE